MWGGETLVRRLPVGDKGASGREEFMKLVSGEILLASSWG